MSNEVVKIKIYRAILKRDVRTLSSMVTFAQIEKQNFKKRTKIDTKGTKPAWNQILEIKCNSNSFAISVYDQGSFGEELVGRGNLNISETTVQDREESVDLMFEEKVVGKIFVKVFSKSKPLDFNPTVQSPKKSVQQNDRKILGNVGNSLLNNSPLSPSNPQPSILDYLSAPTVPLQPSMNCYSPQPGSFNPNSGMMPPPYGYNYAEMQPPSYSPRLYPVSPQQYHQNLLAMSMQMPVNHVYVKSGGSSGQKNANMKNTLRQPSFFTDIKDIANKLF